MRPRAPEWQAAAKTARGAFNLLDFGEKGEGGGGGDGSGDQGGVERKVAWDEGNEANMARKRAGSCRPAPRWSRTAKALLSACIGAWRPRRRLRTAAWRGGRTGRTDKYSGTSPRSFVGEDRS